MKSYPVENPEEFAGVREMRLRDRDVDNILGMYATDAELKRIGNDPRTRERLSLLKNGWRDYRMIQTALNRLTDAIQWTIPKEKRVGFARTATRCKYVVMQGPLASRPKTDTEEIITTSELDDLTFAAWDGKCRMCIDGNCAKCPLGKVLDNVVAIDRDGGCWGNIDIRGRHG